jgi:WD40 repeat protein
VGGEVLLVDAARGDALAKAGGFDDLVTSVAFSPDGSRVAAASADRSARLFTIHDNGRRLDESARLVGHGGPVLAIAFSPDGKTIVTVSADRTVKVWSQGDGKLLRTLGNHTATVQSLAIRPAKVPPVEGVTPFSCATGGEDRTVRVWQPAIGRMVRIVRHHEGRVLALGYAPDGARLFSAGAEGVVRIIDADSDAILSEWAAHDDWVHALAVNPDGKWLATGDWAGNVRMWELGGQRGKRLW